MVAITEVIATAGWGAPKLVPAESITEVLGKPAPPGIFDACDKTHEMISDIIVSVEMQMSSKASLIIAV